MHAAVHSDDLHPIPRHLRDLLPVNPRVRRLLEDPAPVRELGPPRAPHELSARLREIVTRREALTKRHEERLAGEAERLRALDEPPAPKPPRQSRVSEARGGAGWMADRGDDWLEIAREDIEALGPLPERESPRLGRPRKTRVAPDLAAALARIAGVDAPPAHASYAVDQSGGGVQSPSTLPSSGTASVTRLTVPDEARPFVHAPASVQLLDVGAPCGVPACASRARFDGRPCDPVQLPLPLPPWALARHVEPDPPVRRYDAQRVTMGLRSSAAIQARAGPEWLPGFEVLETNC